MAPAAFDAEAGGGQAIAAAAANGAHKPAPGANADAGAAFVLESKGTVRPRLSPAMSMTR
jgi:hypothetical protein